jgi:hypothetical protein
MVPILATWAFVALTPGLGGAHPNHVRAVADDHVRLRLEPGWHGRVTHAGMGYNPAGLAVLTAANFRLPDSATECDGGGLLPRLSRREAIVRIYDYSGATDPGFRPVAVVRPDPIRPVQDSARRTRGFAQSRVRFGGRALAVLVSYGARHPPAATRRAVRRVLASVSPLGTG